MAFEQRRERMVRDHIEARGITHEGVLHAMREVPRERFVPFHLVQYAYSDQPLPIGGGQTISQPYIVALMTAALEPEPEHRVLEIGAGSGYGAAILSRVVSEVITLERYPDLAAEARQRLADLGYDNVTVKVGDGTLGYPELSPYHGILVTASGPSVPPALKEQLAVGGTLVIPVGAPGGAQELRRIRRRSESDYSKQSLGGVRFVPLVGAQGHADNASGMPGRLV